MICVVLKYKNITCCAVTEGTVHERWILIKDSHFTVSHLRQMGVEIVAYVPSSFFSGFRYEDQSDLMEALLVDEKPV